MYIRDLNKDMTVFVQFDKYFMQNDVFEES